MSDIRITGATRLYAIIGDPIAQVKSPEVFSGLFADAGINAVMIPVHVPPDRFDEIVPALMNTGNLDGIIATVPYKARIVRYASKLGATAKRIDALNALRREPDGTWTGEMFDGRGFVRGAEKKGATLRGRNVALFGAGGAGSAIGCELASSGVASLAIIDPQPGRAEALAALLQAAFPATRTSAAAEVPGGTNMIVNASTVGMRDGDGLPGEIGALTGGTLIGDVIVSEEPSPMVRHAMKYGCSFVTGRDMILGQADAVLAFFTQR